MELKKELIDQSAHFAAGLVATVLLAMTIPVYVAALLVLSLAWGREVYQRLSKGNKWYACKSGCQLDMLFWFAGILLAVSLIKTGII